MSKILMSDLKNHEIAKQASYKIFGVREDTREKFIADYCEYCRMVFIVKFIVWRIQKLRYLGLEERFVWDEEIPRFNDIIVRL